MRRSVRGYHPAVAHNARRLRDISGLDQVSFHMSGTEAVMQAARLARYHTRRSLLVRFCGAYDGWWGDVQPGIGNPVPARETYTLKDMDDASLRVLRRRRRAQRQSLCPRYFAGRIGRSLCRVNGRDRPRKIYRGLLKGSCLALRRVPGIRQLRTAREKILSRAD
jgi:hypothetical protein